MIIDTVWWKALGAILTVGLIAICLFNLWDLRREEMAKHREEVKPFVPQSQKTVYLKPCMFIYPKVEAERQDKPGYS